MLDWSIAVIGAWAATAVILMAAPLLLRALGHRGLVAMERLMGMILVIIAVQMFFDGIQAFLEPLSAAG
jgi:multiple antibiotic resistance protein